MSATRVRTEHDAMEHVDGVEVDYRHVQRLWVSQAEIAVARGLGRGFAVELRVPVRHVTTRIRFEDAAGAPYAAAEGFLHHRNETLVKPSDPWLLGAFGARRGPWSFTTRGGITLPLGRTEPDPVALGDAGLPHEHIQCGTGTVDPLLGATAARRVGTGLLAFDALARLTLATNGHGYRAGNRVQGGVSWAHPWRGVRPRVSLDVAHESAERWHGRVDDDEGNLGRTDVLLGLGLARGRFFGGVQVPLVQRVRGAQLDAPLVVSIGWSR